MQCPRCHAENRVERRFCGECGLVLAVTCSSCGFLNEGGEKFCGGCGAPLIAGGPTSPPSLSPDSYTPKHLAEQILTSKAALEGERKQVTVLFADLKASMELLASRDPEEARRILDPVLELMMEAVHHYEGTVNQVMGDGIMALFGAPLAHEDHAVRACYSALRMKTAMATYSERVRRTDGTDVHLRVGLNSGEVVVRAIGSDLRMDYSAVGQTTHLAGRLEQLAPSDTILISGATRRLGGNFITAKPRGRVPIRGLAEPIEVFELAGPGPTKAPWQATRERRRTEFIGRDRELAVLRAAAAAAAGGSTQLVAVVGEPGVGKSRLVSEFTRREIGSSWLLLEAGTVSDGRSHPYAPIANLLRAAFGITETTTFADARAAVAATVGALAPANLEASALLALLSVPPADPTWHDLDPAQHRYRTLHAVADLVGAAAQARPLCVVIEDMHWIDADSEAVLHHLLARLDRARLLMVLTYRPEYPDPWRARSYHSLLALEPLSQPHASRLLGELIGEPPELDALKATLIERTGGNPFFLEESVWDLVETRALVGQRGEYQLARGVSLRDVPQSVEAVVAARIDRLPAHQKGVLQCAAMIGEDVPVVLLEEVTGLGREVVHKTLLDLETADLLYEDVTAPELRYRFKHALTVDVARGSIVSARRRALDARIIEACERHRLNETAEQVERLANHAFRSELWTSAVRYCRAAGMAAVARSAHRAAVEYLERALKASACLPESAASVAEAIDLRLDLRSALIPLGDLKRIVENLREAEGFAAKANDRRRLGRVSAFLTVLFHLLGDLDRAIEKGECALALARELDDRALRIVANAYLGLTYHTAGNYDRALIIARENIALIGDDIRHERFGMTVIPSVYSRTCLAWCLAERGQFSEAAAAAEEALAISESAGHPYSCVYAHLAAGVLHARRSDVAAIEALEQALSLCRSSEITALFATVAVPLAGAYTHAGRAGDALGLLDEANAVAKSIGDPIVHWVRTGARAEALLAAGRPTEALPLALAYLQQRRKLGAKGYEGWGLLLIGDVQAHLDVHAAEAAYREAIALATTLDMPPLRAHCYLGLGRVLTILGRREEARTAIFTAAETFQRLGLRARVAQCEAALTE